MVLTEEGYAAGPRYQIMLGFKVQNWNSNLHSESWWPEQYPQCTCSMTKVAFCTTCEFLSNLQMWLHIKHIAIANKCIILIYCHSIISWRILIHNNSRSLPRWLWKRNKKHLSKRSSINKSVAIQIRQEKDHFISLKLQEWLISK